MPKLSTTTLHLHLHYDRLFFSRSLLKLLIKKDIMLFFNTRLNNLFE